MASDRPVEFVEGRRIDLSDGLGRTVGSHGPETLEEWWARVTRSDFEGAVPKAEEYGGTHDGSADLKIMGYALARLRIPEDAPEAVGQQAACWFYELGKVARGITNLNRGEFIKPDTIHDGRVYWMMMQRLAETGRWP